MAKECQFPTTGTRQYVEAIIHALKLLSIQYHQSALLYLGRKIGGQFLQERVYFSSCNSAYPRAEMLTRNLLQGSNPPTLSKGGCFGPASPCSNVASGQLATQWKIYVSTHAFISLKLETPASNTQVKPRVGLFVALFTLCKMFLELQHRAYPRAEILTPNLTIP